MCVLWVRYGSRLRAPLRGGYRKDEQSRMCSIAVTHYDEAGSLVCIDIDNASRTVQLDRLIVSRMPGGIERLAG